ncbi:hypothetical protein PHISP_05910 [Aspergillus sp. HF37]|nr:hypothetical protein PHISP_05910 [Aspergillus sp. HF37]
MSSSDSDESLMECETEPEIYVAEAEPMYAEDIFAIYEHYVQETRLVGMHTAGPMGAVANTLTMLRRRTLPFYVALTEDMHAPHVLGYAYLSPFRGNPGLGFVSTTELCIYVHPGPHGAVNSEQGVRHRGFELHQGHPSLPEFGEGTVRNIIASVPVDPDGGERGERVVDWFIDCGFVFKGRLSKVGFKFGKWYDVAHLQYTVCTGEA